MTNTRIIKITFQVGFFLEPEYHTHIIAVTENKRKKKHQQQWINNKHHDRPTE